MNMLIGESSYAFYRALAKARDENAALQKTVVGSCTLCEPELAQIGPQACAGHLASSVYFSTIETEVNKKFVASYRKRYGHDALPSADAEASYNTVHLLALALAGADSVDIDRVKKALHGTSFQAPQGKVHVDPESNHSYLTVRLGISREDATFKVISEAKAPVRPDPYLVWAEACGESSAQAETPIAQNNIGLRIVR